MDNRTSLTNCVQQLKSAVSISPQEVRSCLELRTAIEVQATRQAAALATQTGVSDLTSLLKELSNENLPYPELLKVNFRFHRKLIEIVGNPVMQNMMEVIYEFVVVQIAQTTPSPRDNKPGRRLHNDIVAAMKKSAAIKPHDADAAEQAMREPMDAVFERLENRQ